MYICAQLFGVLQVFSWPHPELPDFLRLRGVIVRSVFVLDCGDGALLKATAEGLAVAVYLNCCRCAEGTMYTVYPQLLSWCENRSRCDGDISFVRKGENLTFDLPHLRPCETV